MLVDPEEILVVKKKNLQEINKANRKITLHSDVYRNFQR